MNKFLLLFSLSLFCLSAHADEGSSDKRCKRFISSKAVKKYVSDSRKKEKAKRDAQALAAAVGSATKALQEQACTVEANKDGKVYVRKRHYKHKGRKKKTTITVKCKEV